MTARSRAVTDAVSNPLSARQDETAHSWGVYLVRCADGTLYCGVTNDLDRRLTAHNTGKGARYTRGRAPVTLVAFSGACLDRAAALSLERAVKRLPRSRKASAVGTLAF